MGLSADLPRLASFAFASSGLTWTKVSAGKLLTAQSSHPSILLPKSMSYNFIHAERKVLRNLTPLGQTFLPNNPLQYQNYFQVECLGMLEMILAYPPKSSQTVLVL